MSAWKIGSGEFRSLDLIDAMTETGKPLLVSSGMSSWNDITQIANLLKTRNHAFAFFQCTSRYPSNLENVGLNVIDELHQRIRCPSGLSDHTGTVYPSLAAMSRGAALIEVHVTMSRDMFGPDVPASLTIEECAMLAKARDAFRAMDMTPVDKDELAKEFAQMRSMFAKSLALVKDLPAGTVLECPMLCCKKPAGGIPHTEIDQIVGRTLKLDKSANRLLQMEDLSE
jgi:N-acetylneuraminate synthase